jgi:hypothetical protein
MNIMSNEERGPPASTPYVKPRVSRLGTFRELTRSSGAAFAGMFAADAGCGVTPSSPCPTLV